MEGVFNHCITPRDPRMRRIPGIVSNCWSEVTLEKVPGRWQFGLRHYCRGLLPLIPPFSRFQFILEH